MRKRHVLFIALTLLVLSSSLAPAAERVAVHQGRPVRVMTQNLYVGADIFRVVLAPDPSEIPFIVADVYQTILDTDFPARAERIAAEIDHERPDVIGLQEVSHLTRLAPGDPPDVTVIDFLDILSAAIARRGLEYQVAGVVQDADVELPIVTETGLGLARLIDRDVVLVRKGVRFEDVSAKNYGVFLQIPIGDPPVKIVDFLRGFVTMKVEIGGRWFRLANTHLEIQGGDIDPMVPFVQAAQAQELIGTLAGETLPVVVTGDLNSNPMAPVMPPLYPPYAQFAGSGYVDAWDARLGPWDLGLTCCQDEDLRNPAPSFYERIDFVFVKGDAEVDDVSTLGPAIVTRIGDAPADRTPSGLWPSDHAGVSARLHVPERNGPHRTMSMARGIGSAVAARGGGLQPVRVPAVRGN